MHGFCVTDKSILSQTLCLGSLFVTRPHTSWVWVQSPDLPVCMLENVMLYNTEYPCMTKTAYVYIYIYIYIDMQILLLGFTIVLSQIHPSASAPLSSTTHTCASLWSATHVRIACLSHYLYITNGIPCAPPRPQHWC